ncbi:antitoxin [Salibacterium qingdaonense]|uniref:CopG family transcriptional regulator / antitoxin EndoAI n=1 Tax=Salibacterium qingdaonense TaxID=266892 RepID=A0A1I4I7V4_9BACI|nr:antitoxin [Salibacterium qingdaonense]SFL50462.1 CopG family transcriptional regulator / antitoxin EndoAI [Salibacterium qingdaonense]
MHQSSTKQIKVSLPEYLLNELDRIVEEDDTDRHDFIYQAAEFYLRERRKRRNRESMQQGYLEMANINLHIASESFLAEEEAENSVDDRLVSGV